MDLAAVAEEEGLVDRRLGRILGLAGRRGELPHERRDVPLQLVVNALLDQRDTQSPPLVVGLQDVAHLGVVAVELLLGLLPRLCRPGQAPA